MINFPKRQHHLKHIEQHDGQIRHERFRALHGLCQIQRVEHLDGEDSNLWNEIFHVAGASHNRCLHGELDYREYEYHRCLLHRLYSEVDSNEHRINATQRVSIRMIPSC